MVLWRSSKQTTPALSTCEAEVSAAALTFQILEGLKHLLLEWGADVGIPTLYQDNRSALTVSALGGTWRTRYFAVRASRIAHETLHNNVQLAFCPTKQMVADACTKLSTAEVLASLRSCLNGRFPDMALAIPC